MKRSFCLALMALLYLTSCSNPRDAYTRQYKTKNNDFAEAAMTFDGAYYIAGTTHDKTLQNDEAFLMRVRPNGSPQFIQRYGGKGHDGFSALCEADDGIILAGHTYSDERGYDVYLVKTDARGVLVWERSIGSVHDDWAYSLTRYEDGFVAAGWTYDNEHNNGDIYVVRTDSEGNVLWETAIPGAGDDTANAVCQANDGNILIAGETESLGAGAYDAYFVKLDRNGKLLWQAVYGNKQNDSASAIIPTGNGYVCAASVYTDFASKNDAALLFLDENGKIGAVHTYGGSDYDAGLGICEAPGGYALVGYTYSFGAGDRDIFLISVDTAGNERWRKTYGGVLWDESNVVIPAIGGGFFGAGFVSDNGNGSDVFVFRTDADEGMGAETNAL